MSNTNRRSALPEELADALKRLDAWEQTVRDAQDALRIQVENFQARGWSDEQIDAQTPWKHIAEAFGGQLASALEGRWKNDSALFGHIFFILDTETAGDYLESVLEDDWNCGAQYPTHRVMANVPRDAAGQDKEKTCLYYLVRQEGTFLNTWQVEAETEEEAREKVNKRGVDQLEPDTDMYPSKEFTVSGPFATEDDINWDYE